MESERRNKSIKSFTESLNEFLGDTKSKLVKMVAQYDESESQRILLGPLMPAGRVTLESFGSLADTFTQGCFALMEEAAHHWQIKSAAQIQERANKVEAQMAKQTKKSLRNEIDELKGKTEKKMQLMQAQLDALIKDTSIVVNKQHLKIFALQPAGRLITPTYSFPSTYEHFELLKSLGPDKQFTHLNTKWDTSSKPYKMTGSEICFKNGKTILLGT